MLNIKLNIKAISLLVKIIITTLLLSYAQISLASEPFKIIAGLAKPPYVIEEDQSGFELELVRHVFALSGKSVEYVFVPYGRSKKMLGIDNVDAVLTANEEMFPDITTLSDTYITYQNVAISLKNNNIQLNKIADLSKYSIASFQLANIALGKEFGNAIATSPMFIQVANQEKQVELLVLGRVEVLIMDMKIFEYYVDKLKLKHAKDKVQYHDIFPKSPYKIAFKNTEYMQEFNRSLTAFLSTQAYQNLLAKYKF